MTVVSGLWKAVRVKVVIHLLPLPTMIASWWLAILIARREHQKDTLVLPVFCQTKLCAILRLCQKKVMASVAS